MIPSEVDVLVVGAGPAGCVAAKRCAQLGLKTLLVEKKKLPRDKVCSGMLIGTTARRLVEQEFGAIPDSILAGEKHLEGCIFHVPGQDDEKIDIKIPVTWRRLMDYWMLQSVATQGVEILENARLIHCYQEGEKIVASIEKDKSVKVKCSFLIGADGANSALRKCIFPQFSPRYGHIYQEVHETHIKDLNDGYFHWFYPEDIFPASISIHHKDKRLVIDVNTRPGMTRQIWSWTLNFLIKQYNFHLKSNPIWHGACLEPVIWKELVSGQFLPGKGNILLVGDAAGLLMPVTGEGIGNGILSSLMATDSINQALQSDTIAMTYYLNRLTPLIEKIGATGPWFKRIGEVVRNNPKNLPLTVRDAYLETLQNF